MEKHVLQWHITHKCNLRCLHCYQEEYKENLTLEQIEAIFYQYLSFLKIKGFRGHINLTGGEPLLYPNFFEVLDLFENHGMTYGLLSNGTLLDEALVKRLSGYRGLSFVQISMDGTKKTHEQIRGKGTFEKSLKAIHLLRKYHIQSMVSFTAQKSNYKELSKVIKIMKRHKVDRFWTDRLIPIGNEEAILSTQDFLKMIQILTKEAQKAQRSWFCQTKIHLNRALQFCGGSPLIYHCSAGQQLLTLLANGDLLPCRRMPIVMGNVLEKSIFTLCEEKSALIESIHQLPKACMKCYKASSCRGGLKCLSYAVTQKLQEKDINCPYSF